MAHKSFSEVHIVWSPADKENLNVKGNEMIAWLEDNCIMHIASEEKGESKEITHWDIIAWLKSPSRSDKINDRLRRMMMMMKGSDEYRYGMKTYGIEDDDHVRWYIGYNRKEKGSIMSMMIDDNKMIDDGIKFYVEHPNMMDKKKSCSWSCDDIAKNYVNWLILNKLKHDNDVYKIFRRKNIDKIRLSQYNKLREMKWLEDWLDDHGLMGRNDRLMINELLDENVNVLGLLM